GDRGGGNRRRGLTGFKGGLYWGCDLPKAFNLHGGWLGADDRDCDTGARDRYGDGRGDLRRRVGRGLPCSHVRARIWREDRAEVAGEWRRFRSNRRGFYVYTQAFRT